MSLFGSLVTASSGINAQSKSTAIIANNIANVTTTGFKRSEAAFFDMVTSESELKGSAASGAVTVNRVQRVDQQGQIQETGFLSNVSITGNGFFPVKQSANPAEEFLYTRNGTFDAAIFSPTEDVLRNDAGFFLYAWPIDSNGNIPGNSLASLVPADVSIVETTSRPTTMIETAINLNANQQIINPHSLTPPQQLPVSQQSINGVPDPSQPADFSRSLTVFDNLGASRELVFEFRRVIGPMAHFSSNTNTAFNQSDVLVGNPGGAIVGDILELNDGTNLSSVILTNAPANTALGQANTMQDLLSAVNNFTDGAGNRLYDAQLDSTGQLLIQATNPAVTVDISNSTPSILNDFNFIPDPSSGTLVFNPDASLTAPGAANPQQNNFPAFGNLTNPSTQNWWEMRVLTPPDSSITNPLDPLFGQSIEISKGLINFDGNGRLNAATSLDASGNVVINGDLTLPTVSFDASTPTEDTSITLDMSQFSQFAGTFNVSFTEQNGAPLGERTNVEITRDGTIVALFSNGVRAELYKIPLVNFNNANGLQEISGTAYAESAESGIAEVLEIGSNMGEGFLNGASIEASNVDIANEFAHLIVSQRAFTMSSQLMNTVDEMTERLGQLSR